MNYLPVMTIFVCDHIHVTQDVMGFYNNQSSVIPGEESPQKARREPYTILYSLFVYKTTVVQLVKMRMVWPQDKCSNFFRASDISFKR